MHPELRITEHPAWDPSNGHRRASGMVCRSPRGSGVLRDPHAAGTGKVCFNIKGLAGAGTVSIFVCAANAVRPKHRKNVKPEHL